MEIQDPSMWADLHPVGVRQADETNSAGFEETGNPGHPVYLDNMLIKETTRERARKHPLLAAALELLVALGFVVNTNKSVTDPTQSLEFLGFLLSQLRN